MKRFYITEIILSNLYSPLYAVHRFVFG